MVENQLRTRGITDPRVLAAMLEVPREEFVPLGERFVAYEDGPLPIGRGQTISQPFTVAFMAQALQLQGQEKVLEIGTGSGYGAAVLSRLAREVYTVERIESLAQQAQQHLSRLDYNNVQVFIADGSLGLPNEAPFDAIVVTAGAKNLPQAYVEQLNEGGRIVIPIGDLPNTQTMMRVTKTDGQLTAENLGAFAFVPLIGENGWSSDFL